LSGCGERVEPGAAPRGDSAPVRARTLADALALARAGDAIVLPAGTFEAGVVIPAGVSLRGAGADQTILDARSADVGLTVAGGQGAEIADLTVRGAARSGVLARAAHDLAVRRVRTTASLTGIQLVDVAGGRIENVISDHNRNGIVVEGGRDNTVVNCTVARNAGLGLSFPSGARTRAFNNCVVDSAIGVALGARAEDVRLDYNLYFTLFVGKVAGRAGCKTLEAWQSDGSQDAHSLVLAVAFRDVQAGDFRPAGALDWALDRAATSDWGTAELAGVPAPEHDLTGAARVDRVDVGAFEAAPTPPRPADGRLAIRSDAGRKSAELFAPGGQRVVELFRDLPLPAGSYAFWFPPRDDRGRPIAAGTYELKTFERTREGGEDRVASRSIPVALEEPVARALAAQAAPPARASTRPATPLIRVPRLDHALPIDGELAKWRAAAVAPQVIITPETAAAAIDGPRDAAAVVRIAYLGTDLYIQFLTFDDTPLPQRPDATAAAAATGGDGVAVCLNGAQTGFLFEVTGTAAAGAAVRRRRLLVPGLDLILPPAHCPHAVRVLDRARDVPERALIEAISGADLAGSRVIATELKLPIDETTYQGASRDLFPLRSGQSFGVGFLIFDADDPGSSAPDVLSWPATYDTFNSVDDCALAVLE
jgi:parallel beta-helix repeat protein